MTGVSICLRKWESKNERAQRLMRTDRFGIWGEKEDDTHHLHTPVSMETWPCSSWFSLLFPEGVSSTRRFICRGLKRWRNRVASSHFIHCSLASNMMRKEGGKCKNYVRKPGAHTQSLQPSSNSHVCVRLNQDALVSTHEFSIFLILGKKEAISPRLPWRSQYAVTRSCSPEDVHKSF